MKVGLLGAPGAGKSLVAKRVAKILNEDDLGEWKIVDGYVNKLNQRTGLPFGEASTFAHNFAVMSSRWIAEAELQRQDYNVITCGTIYETIMYSSFTSIFHSANEGELVYDRLFYQTMMQALGGFEQRTYDYDAIFYLPWTPKYAALNEHTWGDVINSKLPEALEGFHKYAITLAGSSASRATEAAEIIRTIRTINVTYAASFEQSGAQSDNPDSESA